MGNPIQAPGEQVQRVTLSRPTTHDILHVGTYMREADAEEVAASLSVGPVAGLVMSVEYSKDEAWTINVDGEPAAICGCPRGVIWLLGTPKLTKDRRLFLEYSPRIWNFICSKYTEVGNMVYDKNTVHIEWLTRMGCTFHGYPSDSPFISFTGPANVLAPSR